MIITALAGLLILGSLLWLLYMSFSRFHHKRARNYSARSSAQPQNMSVNVYGGDDPRSSKKAVRAIPAIPEEDSSRGERW